MGSIDTLNDRIAIYLENLAKLETRIDKLSDVIEEGKKIIYTSALDKVTESV